MKFLRSLVSATLTFIRVPERVQPSRHHIKEEITMRTLRSVLAAATTLVLLAAPASAAPASTGDFVWGSGYRLFPEDGSRRVEYRVGAAALGSHAFGYFSYRHLVVDLRFSGPVTCFDIDGNEAAIGGVITRATGTDPGVGGLLGAGFLVFLIDNGSEPDIVSQTYILPADADADAGNVVVPGDFPRTCPDADETAHDAYGFEGNIVVRDR